MNKVDAIYYINLPHREDRKEKMLNWISVSGFPKDKVNRIEAVYNYEKGYIGCTLSHIKAVETFIQSNKEFCIIYEDDYNPIDLPNYWDNIQKIFDSKLSFDAVLLAYNDYSLLLENTNFDYIKRVFQTYTASGYMITKQFAPILLQNFRQCLELCIEEERNFQRNTEKYCVDVHWIHLMDKYVFLCFYPRLGKQIEGFSDIIKKRVDYKC